MNDQEYMLHQVKAVLAIDSPSGFTKNAVDYLVKEYKALGYEPQVTRKGGVLVQLSAGDGSMPGDGILQEAHLDTLGGMVCGVKANGRLRLTALGGMNPNNAEAENVRIYTREGKVYTGVCQLTDASVHVNGDYSKTERSWDTMEVLLDEMVFSEAEVHALGIENGDIVCFDPRTTVTESGYIKSRFLDDKLSVAILLGYARALKESGKTTRRAVWQHITVFEEVGHGGSASVPEGVGEAISVDMGCVGEGLACKEHQVSICAKDSGGPYHYDVVSGLVAAAKAAGVDYAVDVYPHYGSDVEATLRAGADVRHGLIGAGVYASHGYERSHVKGMIATFQLLNAYIETV